MSTTRRNLHHVPVLLRSPTFTRCCSIYDCRSNTRSNQGRVSAQCYFDYRIPCICCHVQNPVVKNCKTIHERKFCSYCF